MCIRDRHCIDPSTTFSSQNLIYPDNQILSVYFYFRRSTNCWSIGSIISKEEDKTRVWFLKHQNIKISVFRKRRRVEVVDMCGSKSTTQQYGGERTLLNKKKNINSELLHQYFCLTSKSAFSGRLLGIWNIYRFMDRVSYHFYIFVALKKSTVEYIYTFDSLFEIKLLVILSLIKLVARIDIFHIIISCTPKVLYRQ